MARSAIARSIVRFKQLACLGLGGDEVMPALIREMHVIVPSLRNMFFFAKPDGSLDHIYTESMEYAAITQLFITEFNNRKDRDIPGFRYEVAMKTQFGVYDLARFGIDLHKFRRSEFYNELFRPVGRGADYVRLVMRDRGKGLGMLTSFREPRDSHFTPAEQDRLAALEPFFVQALRGRSQKEAPLVDSGQVGMIVVDRRGDPLFASPTGRELLQRACHPKISTVTHVTSALRLPSRLSAMCQDLARLMAGEDIDRSPVYHHRNIHGGFTFRAHPLRGDDPTSGLIGITVTHQEPAPVRMIRRIGELNLSGRQEQICFELASGHEYDVIADKLGISRHTAIAHGRAIYGRLGVHNRTQLATELLAPATVH